MRVVGIIPARYGSTRFPGKPLVPLLGRPLLHWVLAGASQSRKINELLVATDDQRISDSVTEQGHRAVMTPSDLSTGSDRVWAAVKNIKADVVLNIQGDEPLITGEVLDLLIEAFERDPSIDMATLARPLKPGDLHAATTAKIVANCRGEAIYFSRLPIPYSRLQEKELAGACLKHIGIYAYKKTLLEKFCAQAPVPMELAEGLEQLRALYLGARIKIVEVDHDSWGVDTPEDIYKIEPMLEARYGKRKA